MLRRRSWIALAIVLLLTAVAISIGVNRFRYRLIRSDDDLLRFLPREDATIFFANVAALRQAGYLGLLENAKRQQETDYTQFIRQTGFDYTKDLDAIAAALNSRGITFVLRGRFAWERLKQYATRHGGTCADHSCSMPASTQGRWASFRPIQPDAIVLVVSGEAKAANSIRSHQGFRQSSDAPVWLSPSRAVLSNPTRLPLPLRIIAISLQSSDSVVLSLIPAEEGGVAFSVRIDAACLNAATADAARTQLEGNTSMLKRELAREHRQPDPADLTGLLTAGTFQVINKHLIGSWPVRRQLLASLE